MKRVLSLLLALAFLRAETYAISGGPDFGGTIDIVGTYSGVLVQQLTPELIESGESGSMALFTMGIPESGLATGRTLVFSAGRVYSGTITGVGAVTSSDQASFKGIIEASFNFTVSRTVVNPTTGEVTQITSDVTSSANGTVDAEISNANVAAVITTLIKGSAQVLINNGQVDISTLDPIIHNVVDYQLTGFRQSTTVSTTAG